MGSALICSHDRDSMTFARRLFRCASSLLCLAGIASLLAACSGGTHKDAAGNTILSGSFVLALSWEPAFCETSPHVPECRTQTAESIDARQFSLHGLWPEAVYCRVDSGTREADEHHDWQALPEVALSRTVRSELDDAMPGARSLLDRHEWIKHGTCTGVDQERYYAAALALTDAVNASSLPHLFSHHLGGVLSAAEIADALEKDFGAGTGEHIWLECVTDGSRRLISGVRVALKGEIGDNPDLATLATAADRRSPGCRSGVVDPAGFQ